jgi:hypothetical protein
MGTTGTKAVKRASTRSSRSRSKAPKKAKKSKKARRHCKRESSSSSLSSGDRRRVRGRRSPSTSTSSSSSSGDSDWEDFYAKDTFKKVRHLLKTAPPRAPRNVSKGASPSRHQQGRSSTSGRLTKGRKRSGCGSRAAAGVTGMLIIKVLLDGWVTRGTIGSFDTILGLASNP